MTTIHQEFVTACGCTGHAVVGDSTPPTWTLPTDQSPEGMPEGPTVSVCFSVKADDGRVLDQVTVDGDAWRTIESEGLLDENELNTSVDAGASLLDALCEQVDLYANHYTHCGQSWVDEWSAACNDRCPVCNAEIEPTHSCILRALEEGDDGRFRITVDDALYNLPVAA